MIDLKTSITINELQKNGIKYWMLTSDSLENALLNAFKHGIIIAKTNPMVLQGDNEVEI
jgi:magnesium-transporting ATPase (P-type)